MIIKLPVEVIQVACITCSSIDTASLRFTAPLVSLEHPPQAEPQVVDFASPSPSPKLIASENPARHYRRVRHILCQFRLSNGLLNRSVLPNCTRTTTTGNEGYTPYCTNIPRSIISPQTNNRPLSSAPTPAPPNSDCNAILRKSVTATPSNKRGRLSPPSPLIPRALVLCRSQMGG